MKTTLVCALAASTLLAFTTSASARTVYGYLYYEDAKSGQLGSDGITCAMGTEPTNGNKTLRSFPMNILVDGVQQASTITSSSGYYSVYVPDWLSGTLTMEAVADNTVAKIAGSPKFAFPNTYGLVAGTTSVYLSWAMPKSNGYAHRFNILDVIRSGYNYAISKDGDGNDSPAQGLIVNYPAVCPATSGTSGTCYYATNGQIYINGITAYEDEVILHEYGHYLQAQIGALSTSLLTGMGHGECVDYGREHGSATPTTQSYQYAWIEGFPTYFAEAVRATDTSRISDWCFTKKMGTDSPPYWCNWSPCGQPGAAKCNLGGATEWAVWSTLYDVNDSVNDGYDKISSQGTVAFQIFDNELDASLKPAPTISDFAVAFENRNQQYGGTLYHGSMADLDRILQSAGQGTYSGNNFYGGLWSSGTPAGYHALGEYYMNSAYISGSTYVAPGFNVNITGQIGNPGFFYPDEMVEMNVQVAGTSSMTEWNWWPITGLSGVGQFWVTVPPNALEGWTSIILSLDKYDRIPETNESNNITYLSVYVTTCGDGLCAGGKNCSNCPYDCGVCPYCGDGICNGGESYIDCDVDCPEPPENCFVAGTPITMADGSTKPIEDVAIGDLVLSFDESSQQLVSGEVEKLLVHPDSDHLVLLNDTLVTTTAHRFYVDGRWVRASALQVGDPLTRVESGAIQASPLITSASVTHLESRPGSTTTYNFEVARHHDYFAGGLLVHNFKP